VLLDFGDCRLDVAARTLFRGSQEIHLSPKAFELLQLFVETRPRALAKAEILDRIWPGVFVSDASLTRVVNEIRSALGDAARRPRIIRTVHGFGYAFLPTVTSVPVPAQAGTHDRSSVQVASTMPGACWLVHGRREVALPPGECVIGRERDAHVCLASPKVSRRHARLTVAGMLATIEDLSSKNGTSVRGVRITAPVPLEPGDEIQIGPFSLVFQSAIEPMSTETASFADVRRAPRLSKRGKRTKPS
jgi:DNA-binding winged helix-turn-helix (wHTH) protein